jgi:hypothetical protein
MKLAGKSELFSHLAVDFVHPIRLVPVNLPCRRVKK